jgi:hypothetical protein
MVESGSGSRPGDWNVKMLELGPNRIAPKILDLIQVNQIPGGGTGYVETTAVGDDELIGALERHDDSRFLLVHPLARLQFLKCWRHEISPPMLGCVIALPLITSAYAPPSQPLQSTVANRPIVPKTSSDFTRTIRALRIIGWDVSTKDFLDENHSFHDVEAVHPFGTHPRSLLLG